MPLSADHISIVKAEWAGASTAGVRKLGEQVFENMFSKNAEVKPLYSKLDKNGLADLGEKIMRNLRVCILDQIERPEIMAQDLKTLGRRHPQYGVDPNVHSMPMRDALFATIKANNGGTFTEEAWLHLWTLITLSMGLFCR